MMSPVTVKSESTSATNGPSTKKRKDSNRSLNDDDDDDDDDDEDDPDHEEPGEGDSSDSEKDEEEEGPPEYDAEGNLIRKKKRVAGKSCHQSVAAQT